LDLKTETREAETKAVRVRCGCGCEAKLEPFNFSKIAFNINGAAVYSVVCTNPQCENSTEPYFNPLEAIKDWERGDSHKGKLIAA